MNDAPDEIARLRQELELARAEVERLGTRLALRERERELQRRFDEHKERKRKTAEEALRLRILYANLLFQNNPNSLFLFDENLRHVLGSSNCLFGRMPDDLPGKPLRDVFSGRVDAEWLAKIQRQCELVVENMQLWRYNDALRLEGGKNVDVQVIISPVVQEDGVCRGVLITVNDVSELAEARWRAEEADRLKSAFLAQMSHEIRTPMNAIVGIAEILLHDGTLNPEQRGYVGDIRQSSGSLLAVINDILDFSKLDSDKMDLAPVHFSLRAMLDNVGSLATFMASEKGLSFRMETAAGIPDFLYADDVRLRQVLLNLLGNAVKFTARGGVTLGVEALGGMLVFRVADTGMGIRKEDQIGLFEPFFQANAQRQRHIQGTGLGLSICRNLVSLMNGRIEVESASGEGSVFTVTVPLVPGDGEKAVGRGHGEDGEAYSSEARILVVDDNEINLSVAAGLLRTLHGLGCDWAASGREALEKAARTEYDLVFMDHMMPEMDGVEAAARIRALGGRNALVPIVALTANAVAPARDMLLATDMNDFLAKPILKDDLARVLRTWLPEALRATPPPPPDGAGTDGPPLTALAGVEDIDADAGLARLGGDRETYARSLRLLARKIPDADAEMRRTLGAGDLSLFGIHVHGMKGSLASVGADGLSLLAGRLEAAAGEGDADACSREYSVFGNRLALLGRRLDDRFGGEEGANIPRNAVEDGEEPGLLLERLRRSLGEYDYDGISASLDALLRLDLGDARNKTLSRVKNSVDTFDYLTALEELEAFEPA